jgi:hypothetical protein
VARLPYLFATALFLGLVIAKFERETGFTSLLRIGETWAAKRTAAAKTVPSAIVPNSSGYDGQFYAQIALDPALRDPALATALDAPAYRARRILATATAYAAGLGRPSWVLQAYALLNVVCWIALAWLLLRELPVGTPGIRFARWFGCLFSLGALDSVRQSLVDLPALLLVVLALRASRAPSLCKSTFFATLAHLTKETTLLASLALFLHRPLAARRIAFLALTVVPLALWMFYVANRFPLSADTGTGNFTWPFVGALELLSTSAIAVQGGNWDGRHTFGALAVISLFFQAGYLALNRDANSPWWRVGIAHAALLVFLGTWVWSGYWAACRAVLPLTVAFNLLLRPGRAFWPFWALANVTVLHGLWRFL